MCTFSRRQMESIVPWLSMIDRLVLQFGAISNGNKSEENLLFLFIEVVSILCIEVASILFIEVTCSF